MRIDYDLPEITEAPDQDMFALWQAVFAMVHVDGEVSDDEEVIINNVMDAFQFSQEQRDVVRDTMKKPGDVVSLFQKVGSKKHRKQFFILARIIAWCDGIFHDDEREALSAVQDALNNPQDYESELRFLMRKPAVPEGLRGDTDEERMMSHVVLQMAEFYNYPTSE